MKNTVSIVIIGRNEEQSIEQCLTAAIAAADQIGGAEMIFVDSASTDNTAAIVQSYGVRVLSLKPEWKLTPSAGRFVGSHYAGGEYILFIDADTLVYKDFLPAALEHFRDNPQIGGINGWIDDTSESGELLTDVEERFDGVEDVKWLRGPCCFYRREALEKAGSFNPHLVVEEEAELGLRLVKYGWRLQIIPIPMACHTRCYHGQTLQSIISTCKRDIISKRLGETTRTIGYAFKEGFGLTFCWLRLKTTIVFLAWIGLLFLCLLLPKFLYPGADFSILIVLGAVAVFRKKRSFSQTLLFIPSKILNFLDVLAGISKLNFKSPSAYPLDVIEYPSPSPKHR